MNAVPTFALSFLLSCFVGCLAAETTQSRLDRNHKHHHQHASTARRPPVVIFEEPAARPVITNDSDGLSRDPEDCNKGCVGSFQ
jgi:hypothetical protein